MVILAIPGSIFDMFLELSILIATVVFIESLGIMSK